MGVNRSSDCFNSIAQKPPSASERRGRYSGPTPTSSSFTHPRPRRFDKVRSRRQWPTEACARYKAAGWARQSVLAICWPRSSL